MMKIKACRLLAFLLVSGIFSASLLRGGEVTLVTHGFNADGGGWVQAMAEAVQHYPRTVYEHGDATPVFRLAFNDEDELTATKLSGDELDISPSGDLVLVLDWNPYSGGPLDVLGFGAAQSTEFVGPLIAHSLMEPGFIPGLEVPLTRFPLHLIGHSRGGSLVCEIARELGRQGILVDQLTLLDPHPLNQDGFDDPVDVVDGSAKSGVYENVLFADDYFQTLGNGLTVPNGTPADGAFNRSLDDDEIDEGGYPFGGSHGNVHLWYHGTLELVFPETSDGSASIDADLRSRWYVEAEDQGAVAGFYYSRNAGGDRRMDFLPANDDSGNPRSGLNGLWADALGIAPSSNRTLIPEVPEPAVNLIGLELLADPDAFLEDFLLGAPIPVMTLDEESSEFAAAAIFANTTTETARLTLIADDDENSLNGWTAGVQFEIPPTLPSPVRSELDLTSLLGSLAPGLHRIGGILTSESGSRECYAGQRVMVYPRLKLLWSAFDQEGVPGFDFTIQGLRNAAYLLESSRDLEFWAAVESGTLDTGTDNDLVGTAAVSVTAAPEDERLFFRVRYPDSPEE